MSTSVTINGTTYNIPTQSQSPPYGEELSELLSALATVANNSSGTGDILTTSFTIANNQSSAANVTGLTFDTSTVRGAIIDYSIYRSSTTTEMSEVGTIFISYKTTAASWDLSQSYGGTSGVTFTITSGGQVQYVSTNFGGSSYSGKLKFRARAFLQA